MNTEQVHIIGNPRLTGKTVPANTGGKMGSTGVGGNMKDNQAKGMGKKQKAMLGTPEEEDQSLGESLHQWLFQSYCWRPSYKAILSTEQTPDCPLKLPLQYGAQLWYEGCPGIVCSHLLSHVQRYSVPRRISASYTECLMPQAGPYLALVCGAK